MEISVVDSLIRYFCEMAKFGNKQLKRVFKRAKTIPGQCFMKGNYFIDNKKKIDKVQNINDATSCRDECQKHEKCEFWTYAPIDKHCWRQTANTPQTLGYMCNTCTRGPRNCAIGK